MVTIAEKKISVPVVVDYPIPTIKSDVEGVLVTDTSPEITLTLDSGLFADKVTADQISLAGSFAGMTVDKVTAKSNKLTLKLKGDTEIPEGQGYYVDGVIGINASAMENECKPGTVRIPIQESLINFESSEMTVDKNTITVPLTIIGNCKTSQLKAEDIKFVDSNRPIEDTDKESAVEVDVTDVKKISDSRVMVTMEAKGAADRNKAAEILDGRTVKVKDTQIMADFSTATFYPLFDYIEEDGKNFNLKLELRANNGTFSKELKTDVVTLDGDFADAKVASIKRKDDTTAELTISIPMNGQTKENFSYSSSVILEAGSLINSWGDATVQPVEYVRSYSQDTLGRISMNPMLASSLCFPRLSAALGGISTGIMSVTIGFILITTALQMSGLIKDATQQAMEINQIINKDIDRIWDALEETNRNLSEIKTIKNWETINDFSTDLGMLKAYMNKLEWYYKPERVKYLGYEPIEMGSVDIEDENADIEKLDLIKQLSLDMLYADLVDGNKKFANYWNTYNKMVEYYDRCIAALNADGDANPINAYLKVTGDLLNFDTVAYNCRKPFIDNIECTLLLALSKIRLANFGSVEFKENPKTKKIELVSDSPTLEYSEESYQIAIDQMEEIMGNMKDKILEEKDGVTYYNGAYCYTFGIKVNSFDSDNKDVFWAKTWRETDPVFYNQRKSAWLKGGSVFVYSHNKDYKNIIEESYKAPKYLAVDYTWGEPFFSQKAPEGFADDAIYEAKTEDIIAANRDEFVSRMQGRSLREELELAGIKIDEKTFKETPGLPFSSTIVYTMHRPEMWSGKPRNDQYCNGLATTYMDIIKWDDNKLTREVAAAQRETEVYSIDEKYTDWLRDGKTGVWGYKSAGEYDVKNIEMHTEEWCKSNNSAYDSLDDNYGNRNLIPIVRWIIETPDDTGMSPDRDKYMEPTKYLTLKEQMEGKKDKTESSTDESSKTESSKTESKTEG